MHSIINRFPLSVLFITFCNLKYWECEINLDEPKLHTKLFPLELFLSFSWLDTLKTTKYTCLSVVKELVLRHFVVSDLLFVLLMSRKTACLSPWSITYFLFWASKVMHSYYAWKDMSVSVWRSYMSACLFTYIE